MTDVFRRRGDEGTDTHTEGRPYPHREKVATYKPRGEASEETNPAGTLILDFQPPGL